MPEFFFEKPHRLDPSSGVGTFNLLALLRDPANYDVIVNTPDFWIVELTTPTQGLRFIEFYPAAGFRFTTQSGETPPLGAVDLIIFSDTFLGFIWVQMQDLAPLDFSASELITDTTRLVSGDDAFSGSSETLTPEDTFFGGAGNDFLFGGLGDDVLSGSDGDDIIDGGGGSDIMDGGAGIDLVSYFGPLPPVTVTLATQGVPQNTVGSGFDTLSGIEGLEGTDFSDTLSGSPGDNTLIGRAGDDVLSGAAGDDLILGGPGNDVLDPGEGVDLLSYFDASGGVVVNIALPGSQNTGGAGVDTLMGPFEQVEGSAFSDTLSGGSAGETFFGFDGDDFIQGQGGNDRIFGEFGNDVITGGDGVDTVDGGGGDDVFVQSSDPLVDMLAGGAGFDLIDYTFAAQGVVVQLSGYATSGGATIAVFTSVEDARGSAFADALIGTGVDNFLFGGEGADWMLGGDGDDLLAPGIDGGVDRLFGDAGRDVIDYSDVPVGVTVQLTGWASTGAGTLIATFSGIEDAIGTDVNDALIGTNTDNLLFGGAGSDWLVGGGGDDWFTQTFESGDVDRLFGGTPGADMGLDTIDYSLSGAGVVVQLSGYATDGANTIATFSDIENVVGSSFGDALIGNAAANRITGGVGADWLVGGGGDDVFVQDSDRTSIDRLFGDSGNDTIDYSNATVAVVVNLSGYATDLQPVTMATFTGIENAVGGPHDDALIGTAANNVLTGGTGIDWLVGGAGADRFVYLGRDDNDSIRDFSRTEGDQIDLTAIDADSTTPADDAFSFSTMRTSGLPGQVVVVNFGGSSLVSLYLDADDVADQTIQVVHQTGLVMNPGDFSL